MANDQFYEPERPTKSWKLGQRALATSTSEEGIVVEVRWDQIVIQVGDRRLRFHVRFMEKIDDEKKA